MGWTSGWSSLAEVKKHILLSFEKSSTHEIIAQRSTKYGKNFWVAFRYKDTQKSYIALYLIKSHSGDWGYKDMDESMGPCEIDCPTILLDKTTGDDTGYGVEWRKNVRAYHANLKKNSEVNIGDTVKVYGEDYKISRKVKRHFLAVRLSTGREYRLKMNQIERLHNAEDFILNKMEAV